MHRLCGAAPVALHVNLQDGRVVHEAIDWTLNPDLPDLPSSDPEPAKTVDVNRPRQLTSTGQDNCRQPAPLPFRLQVRHAPETERTLAYVALTNSKTATRCCPSLNGLVGAVDNEDTAAPIDFSHVCVAID